MKRQLAPLLIVVLFLSSGVTEGFAAVELDVRRILKLDQKPRDAVMSANGRWI